MAPGGVELRPRRSQEVRRSPELQNSGLRALEEAWDDLLLEAFSCQVWSFSMHQVEAFSCQVWSFSVLLGRLQVAPGGVELRPRRSLEVRGSPGLQNGGLRALGEAWNDFLIGMLYEFSWR